MPGAVGKCLGHTPPKSGVVHLRAEIGEGARRECEHIVWLRSDVGGIAWPRSDPTRQEHLGQRKMRLTKNRERGPALAIDIGSEQSGQTRRHDVCDLLTGPSAIHRKGRPPETDRLRFGPGVECAENRLSQGQAGIGEHLVRHRPFFAIVAHVSTLAHLRWQAR